jgi:hypothetical protein
MGFFSSNRKKKNNKIKHTYLMTYNTNTERTIPQPEIMWNEGNYNTVKEINKQADE